MSRYHEWTDKRGREHRCVEVVAIEDVNGEILDAAQEVEESWFADEPRIDWDNFWDRLDGYEIASHEGRELDLGSETDTPAMRRIQRHIRDLRSQG